MAANLLSLADLCPLHQPRRGGNCPPTVLRRRKVTFPRSPHCPPSPLLTCGLEHPGVKPQLYHHPGAKPQLYHHPGKIHMGWGRMGEGIQTETWLMVQIQNVPMNLSLRAHASDSTQGCLCPSGGHPSAQIPHVPEPDPEPGPLRGMQVSPSTRRNPFFSLGGHPRYG